MPGDGPTVAANSEANDSAKWLGWITERYALLNRRLV